MYEFEELMRKIDMLYEIYRIFIIICRISPIIIAIAYKKLTLWLILITLVLWRTPLPRIILFLNTIEKNKATEQNYKRQDTIISKINLLYEKTKEKSDLLDKLLIKLEEDKKQNKSNNTIW